MTINFRMFHTEFAHRTDLCQIISNLIEILASCNSNLGQKSRIVLILLFVKINDRAVKQKFAFYLSYAAANAKG